MKKYVICIAVIAMTFVLIVSMASFPFNAESEAETKDTDEVIESVTESETETDSAKEMSLSSEGLDLIKNFEGYSQYPQSDYSQWSIGYGSYVCAIDDDPYEIYPNGISIMEADEILMRDVVKHIKAVNVFALENNIVLNQNQFDALVSFTYNVGSNIWKRDPSDFRLKSLLIRGDYTPEEIQEAFYLWRNAGGKENAGLAKRRLREAKLFNSDMNMANPEENGYDVKYYITTATSTRVYSGAASDSTHLGSLRKHTVIPVLYTDESGVYGFTTYAAYFGWVDMSKLICIDEKGSVSVLDENYVDEQGIFYDLDHVDMLASVGKGNEEDNNSGYAGINSGYVFLTKYLLFDNRVYTLTGIGEKAFSHSGNIKKIYISDSITSIAENAFEGSTLVDIYYEGGSYAEQYAKASVYNATNYKCVNSHKFGDWYILNEGDSQNPMTEECVCSVCYDAKQRTIVSLNIVTPPAKTEYFEGDEFDFSGIKALAYFDDGASIDVSKLLSFDDFDSSTLGTKTVKVRYSVFETSLTVRINEIKLISIAVMKTPANTTYVEGTNVDYTGLSVVAQYDNGSSEPIYEYEISECDINTVGKQIITVTYNGFKASFSVTVKARTLTSISIISNPDKLEYYCGEEFDFSGLSMKANYDNGTTETVTEGFNVTKFDSSEPGRLKIRLYYGKFYKSVYVTVILNRFVSEQYAIDGADKCSVLPETKVSEFLSAFESSDMIKVYRLGGKELAGTDIIGNGAYAVLCYNEDKLATLNITVSGDLSGDGRITYSDYLMMSGYFTDSGKISDEAYDVNGDGIVTLADLVCLLSEIKTKNEDEQS